MAIFLTGGTGKTAIRIARLLQEANIPFLIGSRRGETAAPAGMVAIKFDWLDSSTFPNPFRHQFPGKESISAIYLVRPEIAEPELPTNDFIDYALREHRVKRFVLLAGNHVEPGGPQLGNVWQHLLDLEVEYCVLRPTWFMENFSEGEHLTTIRGEGKIYTACGDGKVPFISAGDIAAVAFRALLNEKAQNTDYRLLGAELLTHDEVATKLSSLLGREIVHVKETLAQRKQKYTTFGLETWLVELLLRLEDETAKGAEVRVSNAVELVTGNRPVAFDAFAMQNRAVWL